MHREKVQQLEQENEELKTKQHFCLKNVGDDSTKVRVHTGFATLSALMVCFNFLRPAFEELNYWASNSTNAEIHNKSNKGRKRILAPVEEFSSCLSAPALDYVSKI